MKVYQFIYSIASRLVYMISVISILNISTVFAQENPIKITGAGSTFAYPLYAKWASVYGALTNFSLDYQLISSGEGIKSVVAKKVDFGASDIPLSNDQLKQYKLIQLPTAIAGISIIINLPNVPENQLKLTGVVLADIFLGKIRKWDDPVIKKLNPDLSLPSLPILVAHRTVNSGTTYILTNYLSKASAEWKTKIGNNSVA